MSFVLQTYREVLFTYNLHILQVKSESTYRTFFTAVRDLYRYLFFYCSSRFSLISNFFFFKLKAWVLIRRIF